MKNNQPSTGLPSRIAAFTLIEVLITVLILAIGFLGLAGLQLTALRQNTSAYERSQATMLAYDIIDRMRANKKSYTAGSYTIAYGTTPTATSCTGTGANCSPSQMAAHDLSQWKSAIATTLAGGDGAIAVANNIVTVSISWAEKREQATAADQLTAVSVSTTI